MHLHSVDKTQISNVGIGDLVILGRARSNRRDLRVAGYIANKRPGLIGITALNHFINLAFMMIDAKVPHLLINALAKIIFSITSNIGPGYGLDICDHEKKYEEIGHERA